jgi:MFS family permease
MTQKNTTFCDRVIFLIFSSNLLSYASFILIAPFLPPAYAKKGVSPAMIGGIFAGQSVASTLWSPVIGKLIGRTGAKFWLVGGFILMGVCFISFGLCDRLTDPLALGLIGILIRVFQGIAMGSISTACYSIASNNYPDRTE